MARKRSTAAASDGPAHEGPEPEGPAPVPVPSELSGRFPITDVSPTSLSGRRPAAAAVGEAVPIRATAFREGHDSLGVTALLHRPDGSLAQSVRMTSDGSGLDGWQATVRPDAVGDWRFTIEAWSSPWDSWLHRAMIKIPAGVDVDLEFTEGALLLDRATSERSQSFSRSYGSNLSTSLAYIHPLNRRLCVSET